MSGELVNGRFRIGERLGAGGAGVVHRGYDERLEREVAIKRIEGADPARALREAQAAARLSHPGIVTVYELARRAGSTLLISELVEGPTLERLIAAGALSDRSVAEIGLDLCDALAHAHARGVVHRDVKPANVIVRDDACAPRRTMLADFGIAGLADAATLTADGEILGTLAYMSPEQAAGAPTGPEADIYALGLVLHECWTGANPARMATPALTARRIGEPLPSLAASRPDLPAGLIAAIDACLDPRPGSRPDAGSLAAALEAGRGRLEAEPPSPVLGPPDRARTERPPRARLPAIACLAALVATLAGPLDSPGAALVAAVLGGPAAFLLRGPGALAPLAAPPLAIVGALAIHPALAANAAAGAAGRALAGALGWWWALAAAITLGAGPRLGVAPAAPAGWTGSSEAAAAAVLVPLLAPAALAGAAVCALAALTLGWALSVRHLVLAPLAALPWAAALSAGLGLIGDGSLGERALPAAAAALLGIAIEARRRSRRGRIAGRSPPRGRESPRASPAPIPASHASARAVS